MLSDTAWLDTVLNTVLPFVRAYGCHTCDNVGTKSSEVDSFGPFTVRRSKRHVGSFVIIMYDIEQSCPSYSICLVDIKIGAIT